MIKIVNNNLKKAVIIAMAAIACILMLSSLGFYWQHKTQETKEFERMSAENTRIEAEQKLTREAEELANKFIESDRLCDSETFIGMLGNAQLGGGKDMVRDLMKSRFSNCTPGYFSYSLNGQTDLEENYGYRSSFARTFGYNVKWGAPDSGTYRVTIYKTKDDKWYAFVNKPYELWNLMPLE